MKQYGFVGKGTGKLGASVFAISGGEQIVRQYNPVVSNPNTEAQVAQRAKLKLMSQLGAALAPALGFAKMGLVSARNQFVSKNIGLCTFENNKAGVSLEKIDLTPSNVAFPNIELTAGGGDSISVGLQTGAASDIKRVAYFVFEQIPGDKLKYVASKIVNEAGNERKFTTTFENVSGNIVVYAYGIKDNSVDATTRYENYIAGVNNKGATLDIIPLFRTSGYGLTKSSAVFHTAH